MPPAFLALLTPLTGACEADAPLKSTISPAPLTAFCLNAKSKKWLVFVSRGRNNPVFKANATAKSKNALIFVFRGIGVGKAPLAQPAIKKAVFVARSRFCGRRSRRWTGRGYLKYSSFMLLKWKALSLSPQMRK